jgi:hypothetical protein
MFSFLFLFIKELYLLIYFAAVCFFEQFPNPGFLCLKLFP